MSPRANFLKLKIRPADFEYAIAPKQCVAFCSDVNRVPIREESATARTVQYSAGTKKLEGKLRRRRGGCCRYHVIRIPWFWNPNNFRRGRRRRLLAAEDITDC
jgi:hypothetical protein